jgi:O-antigen ligase
MLVGTAVVGFVVLTAMPQAFWDRMNTIVAPDAQRDESAQGRLYFWTVATNMANANPLTGIGFNAYNRSYNKWDKTNGQYGLSRSVHSVWFGLLAEMGYPGLIYFIALWGVAVWRCSRLQARIRRANPKSHVVHYAVALQTSLIVFAVGGTFLPFQYNEMYWHLIGLGAALEAVAAAELKTVRDESVPAAHGVESTGRRLIPAAAQQQPRGARIAL